MATANKKKKTIVKSKSKSKSSAKVVVNVNSNNKKSRRAQPSTTNIKQPQFVPVMINPNPNHQIPQPPQDAKHLENITKRLDEMDTKLTRQQANLQPTRAVEILDSASVTGTPEKQRAAIRNVDDLNNYLAGNAEAAQMKNAELHRHLTSQGLINVTSATLSNWFNQSKRQAAGQSQGLSMGAAVGTLHGATEVAKRISKSTLGKPQ